MFEVNDPRYDKKSFLIIYNLYIHKDYTQHDDTIVLINSDYAYT